MSCQPTSCGVKSQQNKLFSLSIFDLSLLNCVESRTSGEHKHALDKLLQGGISFGLQKEGVQV